MHKVCLTNFFCSDKVISPKKREEAYSDEDDHQYGQGSRSQATDLGSLVITSGQLPIDPATGAFPEGIQEQTKQSLTNVKAILEAAGLTMDSVVKTTVFLSDMNNSGAMNEVYATFFTEGSYPARSAVEVARLPKDALVEIEVIAAK